MQITIPAKTTFCCKVNTCGARSVVKALYQRRYGNLRQMLEVNVYRGDGGGADLGYDVILAAERRNVLQEVHCYKVSFI